MAVKEEAGPFLLAQGPSLFALAENEVLHKSGDFLGWAMAEAPNVSALQMINGRVCNPMPDVIQGLSDRRRCSAPSKQD